MAQCPTPALGWALSVSSSSRLAWRTSGRSFHSRGGRDMPTSRAVVVSSAHRCRLQHFHSHIFDGARMRKHLRTIVLIGRRQCARDKLQYLWCIWRSSIFMLHSCTRSNAARVYMRTSAVALSCATWAYSKRTS